MTTANSRLHWWRSVRLTFFSLALLTAGEAPAAHAQAVVSYQQQLTAGWSRALSNSDTRNERRSLGVGGTNVQPIGGDETFTLRSQWELRKQGAPFALTITDINPEIRIEQTRSQFNSATVQRSATIYAAPTGVLGDLLPDLRLMPDETLSIFTDP